MGATDALLARYQAEIEERSKFMDGVVEGAETDKRDLTEHEMTLLARTRDRIAEINEQVGPLQSAAKIAAESAQRTAEIAKQFEEARRPGNVSVIEYRSAGEYALDMWRAGLGFDEARSRLEIYNRAASHQTTGDNPGLIPTPILGPVVNFVDESRPLVSAVGPRQLPSGSFSRPIVAQHTSVAAQAGEKTELASRKMTINKLPVTPVTYGGYVNVSRQDIDWTQPAIMDLVISDLAAEYAIATEAAFATAVAGAAVAGPTLPATPTSDNVAAAVWTAAGAVWSATRGQGRLLLAASPDVLGLVGPLFAPVNPIDAQSSGFTASTFGQGAMGAISGIVVVVSAGLAAKSLIALSAAAVEAYEDRVGALQVVEPSVLGVQVAYAGYFTELTILPAGIVKITVT